ncbi:Selenocysteine-specific translation elongation factor [Caenispirillum salinarum AK4]|uniref:Selenocysteine-specific translation elongation factor n=1 Tax=Caenispirillum salinarum AK4 TaxID=1238182 RepID=K9HJY2_9PROT|nr:selenocysteine-specific translation elongation factor [Caenispirillum salinarum]EKV28921.1 Selenocysteine-specific translation elongation factor [Caenispirillum salinarum AK4]
MTRVLLGVMGHVDHGKTSLVGALTGMTTDRLEEEIRRGLSITLGFAHVRRGGIMLSFVDMPGHERFVRTMIAGAGGLDAGLLCVAADEGVMPQTIEHADIAALLGLRRAVVAVTRADKAPDRVPAVEQASRNLLAERGIACAAAVATEAPTGRGVEALADALAALATEDDDEDRGWCALPLDRVFTVRGHGIVGTGTLRHGPLSVGDDLVALPGEGALSVRRLQVHGEAVDRATAGSRVAVNLRGDGCDTLMRGMTLATPGILRPSAWLDVMVSLLPAAPRGVDGGRPFRLLCGTAEADARLRLLDRAALRPGEAAVAQVKTDPAVALAGGDRFVLREASPPRTIGGGVVLDPLSRRRRKRPETVARLEALGDGDRLAAVLTAEGVNGCARRDLPALAALGPARVTERLAAIDAVSLGEIVLSAEGGARVRCEVLKALEAFLRRNPTEAGVTAERLRTLLPEVPWAVVGGTVAALAADGRVESQGGLIRRRDLNPADFLQAQERALVRQMERAVLDGGLAPPDVAELVARRRTRQQALRFLVRTGVLVRTVDRVQKREIIFHVSAVSRAAECLAAGFGDRPFTAGEAGRALGTTRKFTIPLLEHLDRQGVTSRRDNTRRIIRAAVKEPARSGR